MGIQFYNTYSKRKEEFKPIKDGYVGLYTCGPTVYDYAHIGNFRAYIFEDLLRRYLLYRGFDVTQVMNLTDIDDKTIKGCNARGISLAEYTKVYKDAFFEDLDTLKIARAAHYPEATTHIKEMVDLVKRLLDKGAAYRMGDSIYYRIAEFPGYGKLSGMKLEDLKIGARIDAEEYEKETAADFALWKGWDEDDGDVYWETELGKGRPGWHIECSAMSMKYLGETFDIHCGGVDNIFPHHENEIAQSEAATGKRFVNYWLHNAHLMVEGKKMAKSFNNFYTLKDLMDQGLHPMAVRYVLIATHYRQQLNFTFDGVNAALASLQRLWDFYTNVEESSGGDSGGQIASIAHEAEEKFTSALDDDLNISPALAAVFDMVKAANRVMAEVGLGEDDKKILLKALDGFDSVLAFVKPPEGAKIIDEEVERLIQARVDARKNKDFEQADRIRDQLLAQGIILEDTKSGTKWKRKVE